MKKSIVLPVFLLFFVSWLGFAYADLVFPAIAHQFMVSMVVPSYYSIILAVMILAIEAYFIKKLFAVSFVFSFVLSFIVNLISSAAGAFLTTIFFGRGGLEGIMGILGYRDMRFGTYLGLVPGYIFTVILEGFLLILSGKLINKETRLKPVFKTSTFMNLYSYAIILISIVFADILTKGKVFRTF